MRFDLSMAVVIEIVAAVKEALQDHEVRDRIRTIVQEALPPPVDPVERLVDAKGAATVLGMTPSAIRMAAYRESLPYEKNRSPAAISTLAPLQKANRVSKSRRSAAVSMPDSEDLNPPKAWPNPVVDVVADRLEQHPTYASESFTTCFGTDGWLESDQIYGTAQLVRQEIRRSCSIRPPPFDRDLELALGQSGQDDQEARRGHPRRRASTADAGTTSPRLASSSAAVSSASSSCGTSNSRSAVSAKTVTAAPSGRWVCSSSTIAPALTCAEMIRMSERLARPNRSRGLQSILASESVLGLRMTSFGSCSSRRKRSAICKRRWR
jgi:hypothetical protein